MHVDTFSQSTPGTLDAQTLHALSNHLAVVVGFVELVLGATATEDPRRADLLEIRTAALEAARLIGRPLDDPSDRG